MTVYGQLQAAAIHDLIGSLLGRLILIGLAGLLSEDHVADLRDRACGSESLVAERGVALEALFVLRRAVVRVWTSTSGHEVASLKGQRG